MALIIGILAGGSEPAVAEDMTHTIGSPTGGAVESGIVKTADLSHFQPGNVVSDAVFFNKNSMSEAQIQQFLEQKVPRCEAGYVCLKDWYDTSRATSADAMCGAYSGGARERASTIIFKVAQACGINPQVILVTLQKEQGLVTHVWPSDWRYTIAMGQGCPDTAACDTRYYGFFNQVYGAAWQLKRYANPPGTSQYFTWYAPGRTWNILFNPNRGCGSSPVFVQNQATANLYYYTPYQPNAAALRAGYAEGDGCSSYGNRNFFNYFTDWFGSTQYIATDTPFVDVATSPSSPVYNVFASDIVWLADTKITNGWTLWNGEREYRPAESVSRDVMAAFLYRLAGQPAFTPPVASPFTDVPTDYLFYREIAWMASKGISAGWEVGDHWEYRPGEAVTREVLAAFLYRLADEPSFVAPATSPFVDLSTDHVFYKQVAWLASTKISVGWPIDATRSEFRPSAPVTRDVMAAFLHRMHGYLNAFVDVSPIGTSSDYSVFATDIAWLASTGITNGWARADGAREYRPGAAVTRDVMAAFLYRLAGQPAFSAPAMSPFVDVTPDHPFYKEIAWLASTKISVGWAVGSTWEYRPGEAVTREVMASFLYRFAGSPEFTPATTSPFVDVPLDHVFYKEIGWMAATGISVGWPAAGGASEFRPSAAVTRDVMAAFLHRLHARLHP
ncbi:hypothetical protein J2Y46_001918 [Microbacterium sp. BE35]|uniref:S-layer homology domain-containing protein n=1 Tax=Microbacterium sp. BE35 TaxID=2817773 RepID=UPI002866E807|nr:S-layer homology domain-containing protein [Microbacterium sp. BE35]MDR7189095.1 hypothetical protein [Microbacterium sp. BE35]